MLVQSNFFCCALTFVSINQSASSSQRVRLGRINQLEVNLRFQIFDRKTASQQSLPNPSPSQSKIQNLKFQTN
ncbi:MAG: hypothetical protein EAZ90_00585 [Oscillatoriales cyanobacterium]|nr:MAG: hypothetical protein EAZ94_32495 [Oscillatoriales cyanobacterium]TAE30528.1 MAG: hypothetical protein EAZ93_00815 [Oscillatoriales cyanobacterium]TAE45998.1 MAG: hypothetical protein EAZ90_00585 [Oscillatoriales cyanobacterium]TAE50028.1 MAG: hypothetical protein EAZ88_21480 [Oscillatoriales cyanobacterium]TAE65749.1 MAG: hypothetical protein EAZ86_23180 [Oscillatoriales cyanobacterium]